MLWFFAVSFAFIFYVKRTIWNY